jgi:hypothetical protein
MFYPELSRCYPLDLHLVILSFLTTRGYCTTGPFGISFYPGPSSTPIQAVELEPELIKK